MFSFPSILEQLNQHEPLKIGKLGVVFSDDLPPQLLLAREGDDLVGLGDVALQLAIAFHHRLTDNLFNETFSILPKLESFSTSNTLTGRTGRNQGQTRPAGFTPTPSCFTLNEISFHHKSPL